MATHKHTLPFPSEKAIEDYVFDCIKIMNRCPIDNGQYEFVFRQVNLGPYGIADIIKVQIPLNKTYVPDGLYITVLELKNETLKPSDVAQLSRYMAGMTKILEPYKRRLEKKTGFGIWIYGQLAGQFDKDANDLPFLLDLLNEEIDVYDLSMTYGSGFLSKMINKGWSRKIPKQRPLKDLVREVFNHVKSLEKEKHLEPDLKVVK